MAQFISGALSMGYFVAGLIFLRAWVRRRDRLFAAFAGAFWIMSLVRFGLVLTAESTEHQPKLYAFRLLAYLLILGAIVDKNWISRRHFANDNSLADAHQLPER